MTTLSVPVGDDLHQGMTVLIRQGEESNYAEIARKAIKKYLEEKEVESILKSREEPSLEGALDELASQLS